MPMHRFPGAYQTQFWTWPEKSYRCLVSVEFGLEQSLHFVHSLSSCSPDRLTITPAERLQELINTTLIHDTPNPTPYILSWVSKSD